MGSERVHGPYRHRNKWRLVIVGANGQRTVVSRARKADAEALAEKLRQQAGNETVAEAVSAYLATLSHLKPRSQNSERERLDWILRLLETDRALRYLTTEIAEELFEKRSAEVRPDTVINDLGAAKRWARWLVAEGKFSSNPFAELKVKGPRRAGKPQLRVMEARSFLAKALEAEGPEGTACAMALLMGMRASEIRNLVVRDVDDYGRIVWIAQAKTKRGVRRLGVPELLVPRLHALTEGRAPTEKLFGEVSTAWLARWVIRTCERAGVPRVTPHGLRGTWATLAVGVVDTDAAAAALGHASSITRGHYALPGAEASRQSAKIAGELSDTRTPVVPVRPVDTWVTRAENELPVSNSRSDATGVESGTPGDFSGFPRLVREQ